MGAVDDLLAAWRRNPDADATVALCSYLGASGQEGLIREVGASAETWHVKDADVMLSVGRMYLDAGLLPEAQSSLVIAGKVHPDDARPFRFLGEVLLRRGDALRAEKVLARAVMLGESDTHAQNLHERATFYMALQKRVGMQAVAKEVARALPRRVSIPAPALAPGQARSLGTQGLQRPFESADAVEISDVTSIDPIDFGGAAVAARAVPMRAMSRTAIGIGGMPNAQVPGRPPSIADLSDAAVMEASEPSLPRFGVPQRPAPAPAPAFSRTAAMPAPASARGVPAPSAPSRAAPTPPVPSAPLPAFVPRGFAPPAPAYGTAHPGFDDSPQPTADLVLEHLARVGVFEPAGGAAPAWEQAPRVRTRGNWLLFTAIVFLLAGGGGGYEYARRQKIQRIQRAESLSAEVDRMLHSGRPADLRSTDAELSKIFDLDSRSTRAARQWLHNRVLGALLLEGEPRGIDSAVHRGRVAGLAEKELVVGRVASFLAEGDVAGAAAMLPKNDAQTSGDALYQLVAGAVLERAGDPRAVERYQAARRLDPKLVPAGILLARLLLLEHGAGAGRPVIEELTRQSVDLSIVRALHALAWVVDSERPAAAPELKPEEARRLPLPLLAVPAMLEAAQAMAAGERERAEKAIGAAIGATGSPALAARMGFLAIEAGNEKLARKGALMALQLAPLHPNARALAGRVALLGGRLDEAEKVAENLAADSPDVAIVQAVVAYERADATALAGVLDAVGERAQSPAFSALVAGKTMLQGGGYPVPDKLKALASPSVPWGELVAMDGALDTGNLELARELLARRGESLTPTHLLRLARLERYSKKNDAALAASERAMNGAQTPALVVERAYELMDTKEPARVKDLLKRFGSAMPELAPWLEVLVEIADKQPARAKARAGLLDLPAPQAPAFLRIFAARTLIFAGDRRGRAYVVGTARKLARHPDLHLALEAF